MSTRLINNLCGRIGIVVGSVLIWCAYASGASILNLEVIPDGSADPPGDRLEFLPLLARGNKKPRAKCAAYTVSADRKHTNPIRSNGTTDRDSDGFFLISRRVQAQDKGTETLRIVIPYADLKLEDGTHWLGYCVTIKTAGQPPKEAATHLTQVKISDQPRTKMTVEQATVKPSLESHEQIAVIGGKAEAKSAESSRQKFSVPLPKLKRESKTTEIAVNIPGGFQRRVSPPEVTRGDESGYAERDRLSASPVALASLSDSQPPDQRLVYFATNRAQSENSTATNPQFSNEVGTELITGKCLVNIPVQHQIGNLEQPSFWRQPNPNQDFLVESTEIIPGNQIFKEATSKDLFLYIHGFNTEFDFAVLRAAQLRYDLNFPGAAMAMSWPSAGSMLSYAEDRQNAEKSAELSADLLQSLITSSHRTSDGNQPRRIHLLAHSLGNHVLLNAVYQLHSRKVLPENELWFGQVILAAPDVGALEFNNLLPYVIQHSERVTYYYCTHDAALAVSRQTNEYEPVGLLAFFQNGLDTINTDAVDTSFMYHGYYASAHQVLSDVGLLVNQHFAPDKRLPPLAPANSVFGHRHWSFASQMLTATNPATESAH